MNFMEWATVLLVGFTLGFNLSECLRQRSAWRRSKTK